MGTSKITILLENNRSRRGAQYDLVKDILIQTVCWGHFVSGLNISTHVEKSKSENEARGSTPSHFGTWYHLRLR